MKRIDSRTVELTDEELSLTDQFQARLDTGDGITAAAIAVLRPALGKVTRDFVEYLSDCTLTLRRDELIVRRDRTDERGGAGRWYIVLVAIVMSAFFTVMHTGVAANAQPYGGCDEAPAYSDSDGAQWCRDRGWMIRPRLAVNPHGVLRASAVAHCEYEDGTPGRRVCLWDASTDGAANGGVSFLMFGEYDTSYRVVYVWMSNPTRSRGVDWVTRSQDRRLDRVAFPQDWTRCVTLVGPRTVVRCPDGYRVGL